MLVSIANAIDTKKTSIQKHFFINYHLAYIGLHFLNDPEIKNKTIDLFNELIDSFHKLYRYNNSKEQCICMLSRLNFYCAIATTNYLYYQTSHNIFTSHFIESDFEIFRFNLIQPFKRCEKFLKLYHQYKNEWENKRHDLLFLDQWENTRSKIIEVQRNVIYDDPWKNVLSNIKIDSLDLDQWEFNILYELY